ncbi:MAG: transporter [Bradymonadaceae bacterium]
MERSQSKRLCRMMGRLVVASAMTVSASAAVAQDHGSLDIQTFRPALGPHAVFTTESADTLSHLQPAGALVIDYLSRPLVLGFEDDTTQAVIDQQLAAHLLGGIGAWDVAQFDIGLPVFLVNDGQYGTQDIRGAAVGDLTVRSKFGLLSSRTGPVGVGANLGLTLPTGNSDAFVGSSGVTVSPTLVGDTRFDTPIGQTVIALNLGLRFRSAEEVHDLEVGSNMLYRLGAQVEVIENLLEIGAELYGTTLLGDFFGSAAGSPLEAIIGAKIQTGDGFSIVAGSGGGLVGGLGSPEFRAFLGLNYALPVVTGTTVDETDYPVEEEEEEELIEEEGGIEDPLEEDDVIEEPVVEEPAVEEPVEKEEAAPDAEEEPTDGEEEIIEESFEPAEAPPADDAP